MTPDLLDDLLDRSAPLRESPPSADFDAMIADARGEVPRVHRAPILITAGALAVVLGGGAGVAAATDGFAAWAPWAQNSVRAVPFTMANGFECELRFSEWTGGTDQAFLNEVNSILESWYGSTDVVAAARLLVPSALDDLGPGIELAPGETLDTLPPGEAEHREWAKQWVAWDIAVSEAESNELARHDIAPGDPRFGASERSSQIQCFDEDHELYVPGAGS
jgi:hypothetical protein